MPSSLLSVSTLFTETHTATLSLAPSGHTDVDAVCPTDVSVSLIDDVATIPKLHDSRTISSWEGQRALASPFSSCLLSLLSVIGPAPLSSFDWLLWGSGGFSVKSGCNVTVWGSFHLTVWTASASPCTPEPWSSHSKLHLSVEEEPFVGDDCLLLSTNDGTQVLPCLPPVLTDPSLLLLSSSLKGVWQTSLCCFAWPSFSLVGGAFSLPEAVFLLQELNRTCTFKYVHASNEMHYNQNACTYKCMYVCIWTCMLTHTCTHTHTHLLYIHM